jgi:hypothetical protein
MSYNIFLTNGSALTTVADGTVDTTTTSLSLIGRNYAGYGSFLNENFVSLLENSSNPTSPTKPLVGQLWWDSTGRHLNVWQGTGWKVISSSLTGSAAPTYPVTGDFWWNTLTNTFSVFNGSQWIAIGPVIPPGTAVTSLLSDSVTDTSAQLHTVGNIIVNSKLVAVASSDVAFNLSTPLGGLTTLNPGFNMVAGSGITATNVVAQTANITSIIAGNLTVSGNVTFTGNVNLPVEPVQIFSSDIVPSANLSYNLGSATSWWNNIYGTSIHAQYADLAERFESDADYEPGTVVELGGVAEVTRVVDELSDSVFGVISTNAAFVMNSKAGNNSTHPPVAVQGRVPVKVIGKIRKGDRLVSAGNGIARAGTKQELTAWNVIGRSLQNKDTDDVGNIEAVVKINS